MPRVIHTTAYGIGELEGKAKDRARRWYIDEVLNTSGTWHEAVFDDFEQICTILGITLKKHQQRVAGRRGSAVERPCIWFSGFCHQGDGACFEGEWEYAGGCSQRIRKHAATDAQLHVIADALTAAQRPNFYRLRADIGHQGLYYHEHSMTISIERDDADGREPTEGTAESAAETLRDLARWLYRQLESEYEAECSDEAVDDSLEANEWLFNRQGRFISWIEDEATRNGGSGDAGQARA